MARRVWAGNAVAVIASGPSLTQADCDLIEAAGIPTIAVNSSWKMARFADAVYAGDACWWDAYGHEVDIPAEKWTCSRQAAAKHRINHHQAYGGYNSGMRAIQFAVERGAARVILLGFDCSIANGLHWHGAHDRTQNPDEGKVKKWHVQFKTVAALAKLRRCEVINCSRYTELTCFPTQELEAALEWAESPCLQPCLDEPTHCMSLSMPGERDSSATQTRISSQKNGRLSVSPSN